MTVIVERLLAYESKLVALSRSTRAMALLGITLLSTIVCYVAIIVLFGHLYGTGEHWAHLAGMIAIIVLPGVIGTTSFQAFWILGIGLPEVRRPIHYLLLLTLFLNIPIGIVLGLSITELIDVTFYQFVFNFPIPIFGTLPEIANFSPLGFMLLGGWISGAIYLAVISTRWDAKAAGRISRIASRAIGNVVLTIAPTQLLVFGLFIGAMAMSGTWI